MDIPKTIQTIEYMLSRHSYNDDQQEALETALSALNLDWDFTNQLPDIVKGILEVKYQKMFDLGVMVMRSRLTDKVCDLMITMLNDRMIETSDIEKVITNIRETLEKEQV